MNYNYGSLTKKEVSEIVSKNAKEDIPVYSLEERFAKDTLANKQHCGVFEYANGIVTKDGKRLKGVRGYYYKNKCVYAEFRTDAGDYVCFVQHTIQKRDPKYNLPFLETDSVDKQITEDKKETVSDNSQVNSNGSDTNAPKSTSDVTNPKPRYYQTKMQNGTDNAHVGNSSNASAEMGVGTPSSTVTKRTTAFHVGASYSSHTVSHTGTSQIRTHSTQVINNTSVSKSQNAPQQKSSVPNNTQFFAKGNENNMTIFGDLTKLDEESLKEFYTSLSVFISKVTKSCDKMDSEIASCDEEMRDPLCQNILSVNRDILNKIRNCIKPAEDLKLKIDKLFTEFESVSAIERGLE